MQYQDSYMAERGEGLQYEERVCSTEMVTSQYEARVCSMRRGCAVSRQLHHSMMLDCSV